jgi:toxin HigB-1
VRGVPAQSVEKLRAMLTAIEKAEDIGEIGLFSGWRLHALKGDRKGTWSMTVTRNYRLTFKLRDKSVTDIDLEDYH